MKKFLLISCLLLTNVFAAGVPFKPQTDTIQLGKDGSSDDKQIVVNVGDGTSNPKILIDKITKIFEFSKGMDVNGSISSNSNIVGAIVSSTGNLSVGVNANITGEVSIESGVLKLGVTNAQFRIASGLIEFSNNGTDWQKLGAGSGGETGITKVDDESPAFVKKTATTISIKAKTSLLVNGLLIEFPTETPVIMPSLVAGTDYAIYICDDGTIRASDNWSAPAGYTTANSKKAGGFHYSLISPTESVVSGSFATTGSGMIWTQPDVDKIRGINQFSIWDLKFRPKASDPRGYALVSNSVWVAIYFTGTSHAVNGLSRAGTDVASGTVLPKIPSEFGGNGTATYSTLNWWEANEIAKSQGARLIKEEEFVAAAFGVTENQSLGGAATTIPLTKREAGYTSKYGIEQASGHHWTWGSDPGFIYTSTAAPTYRANGGRGQYYTQGTTGTGSTARTCKLDSARRRPPPIQPSIRLNARPIPLSEQSWQAAKSRRGMYHDRLHLSFYPNKGI